LAAGANWQQQGAADYAWNNLRRIPYSTLATYSNRNAVNCATLVWQAFYSQGLRLNTGPGSTVLPSTINNDSRTSVISHVNWPGTAW